MNVSLSAAELLTRCRVLYTHTHTHTKIVKKVPVSSCTNEDDNPAEIYNWKRINSLLNCNEISKPRVLVHFNGFTRLELVLCFLEERVIQMKSMLFKINPIQVSLFDHC